MKLLQLSAMAAAAALLVACGGSDDDSGPKRGDLIDPARVVGELTPAQIDAATASSGLQALTGTAKCGVKILLLNYVTVGAKGEKGANASGALLVPTGPLAPQYVIIAATMVPIDLIVMGGYASLAARLLRWLTTPRQQTAVNRVFSGLFALAAVGLSLMRRGAAA